MEDRIDIRAALEMLGTGWAFGGSVTDGTEDCWASVQWEDARMKPEWDVLVIAHKEAVRRSEAPLPDVPLGEIDHIIKTMPTIGWHILAQMGIE